jgi:ribosomal-protein-alanine N-acetyltransferase
MQSPNAVNISKYTKDMKPYCLEAFTSNVPAYFTVAEIDQFENWLNQLEEEKSDRHYFVVTLNNRVVACGGFGYNENNHTVSFAWGLVHRDFHKQGIGKMLAAYRLNKIRELYPGVDIILDTTQHSYTFFERLGFVTVKYTKDGYAEGMHRYDMVLTGFTS